MFSYTDNGCMMSRFKNIYGQNHDPNAYFFRVSEFQKSLGCERKICAAQNIY